jgi:hypothetical protein
MRASPVACSEAWLYGRLNNSLNRRYEEVLGYPALRVNFLAGVRASFSLR